MRGSRRGIYARRLVKESRKPQTPPAADGVHLLPAAAGTHVLLPGNVADDSAARRGPPQRACEAVYRSSRRGPISATCQGFAVKVGHGPCGSALAWEQFMIGVGTWLSGRLISPRQRPGKVVGLYFVELAALCAVNIIH